MITVWVTLCEYPVLYSYFLRSQADAVAINRAFHLYIICLCAEVFVGWVSAIRHDLYFVTF